MTEPAASTALLSSRDGTRLHLRVHECAAPRAALLIVHGLGEHAARYDEFAAFLATSHAVSTFAVDLRGHGRSAGQRGHTARLAHFLDDVAAAHDHVAGALPAVPVFLLGQSMGGLVVLRYLQERRPPAAAIICSPWLGTALPVPLWKRALAPLAGVLAPRLPFASGIQAEHLSHDVALVQRYRDDPLVHGRITPGAFRQVRRAIRDAHDRADRITLPVLFLLSGDDHIVSTPAAQQFAGRVAAPDTTVETLPGHFHELLNETDRRQTWQRIAAWLVERL